jgi:hypothetical protein
MTIYHNPKAKYLRRPIHPVFLESDKPAYYSRRCWDMAVQKAVIFLNHNGFPDIRFKAIGDRKVVALFFKAIGLQPPTGEPVHRLMDLYLQDLWPFYAYDYGFCQSDEWRELREQVFKKHGRFCAKCGSVEHLHIDHVKPKSLHPGLRLDISNMQVLCAKCNMSKGNRNTVDYSQRGVKKLAVDAIMAEYVGFFKGRSRSKRMVGQRKILPPKARQPIKYALEVHKLLETPSSQLMSWFFTERDGIIPICLLGAGQFDKFFEFVAQLAATKIHLEEPF